MKRWYALDFVSDEECELVYDGQLYDTEGAAEAARDAMHRPELFEVNWYGIKDLEEVFGDRFEIDEHLRVQL